jgi:GT2 family glycosyltransferase
VPVYNHLDFTKNCVFSILRNTISEEFEIVVVSNGCTDETNEWVLQMQRVDPRIVLLSYREPLGVTQAFNAGLQTSRGDYLVILNNDVEILGTHWLKILVQPFSRPEVAATGPLKLWSPEANTEFLVFCCVMIPRRVLDVVGYLSTEFGVGYGEDIDWCKRAILEGFKIVLVPEGVKLIVKDGLWVQEGSGFPIYHRGEGTVHDIKDWNKITAENREKLKAKYAAK